MASPIKTIVILVQENRSFDHMLGWMKSINPEIDGVTGKESNLLSTTNHESQRLYHTNKAGFIQPDPGHSFEATYEQIFGKEWSEGAHDHLTPTMDGFAQQAEKVQPGLSEVVMSGFEPDSLPVYKELISEFAVCDRLYVHSATSYGATTNDNKSMIEGYPQKTIFESVEEGGHSFGIYYQLPPSTLFFRNLRKLKYIDNFHQFDLHFKHHCKEGKLPNYVVVEQMYFGIKGIPGNDDHPSHDVSDGQKFVKEVYEALRSSPQWNEILFVVLYDEHGGFYDHVPTPHVGIPNPDGLVGPPPYNFNFDRLGVRVPAILVSPWIERGTERAFILHEFEHSSIPATVKKIFGLKSHLTKRDEWAGTFEGVASRTTPRTDCPVTLPDPKKMRETEPDENEKLSEFQQELVQLGAVLNGDSKKDTFPHKLVENMTVTEGASYVESAFKKFCDDCDQAKRDGKDGSHIVCLEEATPSTRKSSKSFSQKEGKLPNYVVVEQRYFGIKGVPGNDDHPSHDVSDGQKFVKEVYEALRSSPQWNEILFVVLYDEHGGFYDHVPTPHVGIPNPDGLVGPPPYNFNFNRLGVRVPAILVSPWIERGTERAFILHEFEHSSIPATVKKIFGLKSHLTKRDEWAGTFEGVASRTTPRTDCPEFFLTAVSFINLTLPVTRNNVLQMCAIVTLPDPKKMRETEPDENEKLSEFQQELVQLGAVLNGDSKKDTFPHKLVENMTVTEGASYVERSFEKFCVSVTQPKEMARGTYIVV
ncbi:non-specific phospholipase C3-like protein [Tanacetum coccineum]